MSKIINNDQLNENSQDYDSINVLTKDLEDSSVKELIKLKKKTACFHSCQNYGI